MEVHLPRPGRTGARAAVDELAASFAATLGGLSTEQMTCQMRRLVTRARKIVLQVAAIVWVVAMLAQFELDSRYVYYPRVANPEIGRTEPYAVKGYRGLRHQRSARVSRVASMA